VEQLVKAGGNAWVPPEACLVTGYLDAPPKSLAMVEIAEAQESGAD
jgi:hypothetical protein